MTRIVAVVLSGTTVVLAVWLAVYHAMPREGGDASTDHSADEGEPSLRVVPVSVGAPSRGHRPERASTDPSLDTGAPARAEDGWI